MALRFTRFPSAAVEALGVQALVVKTVMTSLQDREQLAADVLKFAERLSLV